MKFLHSLQALAFVMLVCASTGCARWTLFPKSAAPIPGPTENSSSSLQQAAGGEPAASANGEDAAANVRQALNDLQQLEPALAMARLAERQGEPDEARRQYLRYMEKNPRHPLPHHRLGVMAAREAKYAEAEEHFRMAGRLAPPSAQLLSDMGYLYYLQDRLGEAENLLRQATTMEPANHNANNNLALVLGAKGNMSHSLSQFRRVNDEAHARANVAFLHSQRGDLEASRQEYLKALTLDKTLTTAARALLQVEEARKREVVALAEYKANAGDEFIAGQNAQPTHMTVQPQAMPQAQQMQMHSTQMQAAHVQSQPMQTAQSSAQQMANYPTQPVQQTAYSQYPALQAKPNYPMTSPQQFSQTSTPAAEGVNQTAMLMPIPQPPEESNVPAEGISSSFEDSAVRTASYEETGSAFSASEPRSVASPQTSAQGGATNMHSSEDRWGSAWQQLTDASKTVSDEQDSVQWAQPDSDPQSSETPETDTPASGGVSISIGG